MTTDRPQKTFLQIMYMCLGFFGIQFGWALQMGNMSAIYSRLGAREDQIPLLWLAAPVTGLLVQPLVGYFSDRTWCRLGRRRPYFLGGAIFSVIALILMPQASAIWMAVIALWVLDTSVNVSMEPFRAFVGDILPEQQRKTGYAMQSVMIGAGAKILGNIKIGEGAKIGAGSVVLSEVAPHTTVAGIPARVVGRPRQAMPALEMDQKLDTAGPICTEGCGVICKKDV